MAPLAPMLTYPLIMYQPINWISKLYTRCLLLRKGTLEINHRVLKNLRIARIILAESVVLSWEQKILIAYIFCNTSINSWKKVELEKKRKIVLFEETNEE